MSDAPQPEPSAPIPAPTVAPTNASVASVVPVDEDIAYTWERLSYRVLSDTEITGEDGKPKRIKDWKTILQPMTGTARPRRSLAIMGPSGAGKTTLLNAIAGRLHTDKEHVTDGCVFLNDTVFGDAYKKIVSFVAQDDIVMGKETPREAMYFSYRMKRNAPHEEAVEQVNATLDRLHMHGCADTLLGIPGLIKGVSGGEKKRTNIGAELISNPIVMLLDEPTTGLDSVNAHRVGTVLRTLAHDEGRTVICTIHTPSSELYDLFDDILLLARGRVAYHGPRREAPAWFAGLGFPVPPHYNPAEFYMSLLQRAPADLNKILDAWAEHTTTPSGNANRSLMSGPTDPQYHNAKMLSALKHEGASVGTQFRLLTVRSWRLYTRDPIGTIGRAVQTIFMALLIGLFYLNLKKDWSGVQDRLGALFMIAINMVFLNIMPGIMAFPPERAVFLMEQSNDLYHASVYFLCKTIAETPFQIIFPLIYTIITYWMLDLNNSAAAFFSYLAIMIWVSNTAYSFGLLAAAFFPSAEIALALVPLCMLPMMLAAGLLAQTDRLDPYWIWLNYISFPRYAFSALTINEFSRVGSLCPVLPANATFAEQVASCPRYSNGDEVIASLGFDDDKRVSWEISMIALSVMIVVFRFLAALALSRQGAARRASVVFKDNIAALLEARKH